jgi:small-conductance mechanosensitive channel
MTSLPDALPSEVWFALAVLVVGLVLGTVVGALNRRILRRLRVPDLIEGTAFERTARDFGTSTVNIIARLSTLFVVGVALLAALSVTRADYTTRFLEAVAAFLPRLFVASVIVIVGVVVGDKAALLVSERLRAVKVPQVSLLAALAKYTVFYVAGLIALSQVGVATDALVVLLAAYLFALVFLGGLAFSDLLSAGAAGVYLLLTQPYGIGDEIRVDGTTGVVQEVDLFVTHVEADGDEYVLPNDHVFGEGFVRVR